MTSLLKRRYIEAGRFGKRGIIYVIISLIGFIVELVRYGISRPFALVMWAIVFFIGSLVFFFMTDIKN